MLHNITKKNDFYCGSFAWEISECGRFYAPEREPVQLPEFPCLCGSLPHRTGGLAGMKVMHLYRSAKTLSGVK